MQVELVNNNGYSGSIERCIGKVFTAKQFYGTLILIPVKELQAAGYEGDAVGIMDDLSFDYDAVRVIDES